MLALPLLVSRVALERDMRSLFWAEALMERDSLVAEAGLRTD